MIPGRCSFLRESATIPARLTVANGRIILFFRGERSMKDSAERRFDGRVHAAVAPRVAPRDPSTLDACMACTRERARKETRHDAFMPRARASAAGYTCAAYLGQRNALMHVPGGRSRAKDPLFALFAGPVVHVVKWRCSNSLSRWITLRAFKRVSSGDARRASRHRMTKRLVPIQCFEQPSSARLARQSIISFSQLTEAQYEFAVRLLEICTERALDKREPESGNPIPLSGSNAFANRRGFSVPDAIVHEKFTFSAAFLTFVPSSAN